MTARELLGLFIFAMAVGLLATGAIIQFPAEPIWAFLVVAVGMAIISWVVWG